MCALSHSGDADACPLVYAAVQADVRAVEYGRLSCVGLKGPPSRGKVDPAATDDAAAAALWAKSGEVPGGAYHG